MGEGEAGGEPPRTPPGQRSRSRDQGSSSIELLKEPLYVCWLIEEPYCGMQRWIGTMGSRELLPGDSL